MTFQTRHRIICGDSRGMTELDDRSVHLVITSPPYWQLKDYGTDEQIGFNDSYENYINNLNLVWKECYRVLDNGCRLCINIGDQFARSVYYGRYKVIPIRTEIIKFCECIGFDYMGAVIPIRTEIIKFCECIGFDYMGAVIWQKKTTMNTTRGCVSDFDIHISDLKKGETMGDSHKKSIGYILWIFGFTGAHRFYYGKPISGTIWFFTLGLVGIGWLIDLFLIPSMDREADLRFREGEVDYNVAWILLTFVGVFGIHRFYIGKWGTGIIYLLTGGIFLVGVVYDFWTLNDQIHIINASKE